MLRFAAALAAGVVMSGAARADCTDRNRDEGFCFTTAPGYTANNGGLVGGGIVPLSVTPRCAPGWTMVYVDSVGKGPSKKCAAVGDLRDPE